MRGISYLSWEEEAKAKEIAVADWSRDNFVDIGIRKDDHENMQLMQQVREDIENWMMRSTVSLLFLSFLCHLFVNMSLPALRSLAVFAVSPKKLRVLSLGAI